jgi:pterin-4a-carbinolamine dehydratase
MTRIEVQKKLAETPKWNILQEKLMCELRQHVENFNTQWRMARTVQTKKQKFIKQVPALSHQKDISK